MLTFNVILGYQGLLFRDFLGLFLGFFFDPTDRPNTKKKKGGMAQSRWNFKERVFRRRRVKLPI